VELVSEYMYRTGSIKGGRVTSGAVGSWGDETEPFSGPLRVMVGKKCQGRSKYPIT
jgi:hypothetical protein